MEIIILIRWIILILLMIAGGIVISRLKSKINMNKINKILIIGGYILGLFWFIRSFYFLGFTENGSYDEGQIIFLLIASVGLLITLYFKTRTTKSSINKMKESTLDQVNAKIKALTFSLQKEVIGSTEYLRVEKEIARLKGISKS